METRELPKDIDGSRREEFRLWPIYRTTFDESFIGSPDQ